MGCYNWCSGGKLQNQFPYLYSLECKKRWTVVERIKAHGFEWNWACDVHNAGLTHKQNKITTIVGLFTLGAASDGWKCGLDSSWIFTTGVVRVKVANNTPGFPLNRI